MLISTAAVSATDTDTDSIISAGIGSCEAYLEEQLTAAHDDGGVSYGYEWYIITMLRAGKSVSQEILDEYYASVCETVKEWDADIKPTDAERTALALTVMGKDITDVDGVNLAELICNSEKLKDGANELAYALITIYASGEEPEAAVWSRELIIAELLKFQAADGGFGLYDNTEADVDMTAICLQALAPYTDEEGVLAAVENAVEYLRSNISEEWGYADNTNSAAQVLSALAALGTDVTNIENGFGSSEENIITGLEKHRNTDGNGYLYGDTVNPMATVQVMQAYDAYRKAQKEELMYWDFKTEGEIYDDSSANEDTPPEENEAEPVDIYVTIADDGRVVKDKDGEYVAQAKVTVTDLDKNGTLTVDEALYATHEEYYDGGAESGYSSFESAYGLSLAILWGKGTENTSAASGYYLNNASCMSLNDEVKEGDYLTAFNYYDTTTWGDAYSFFSENTAETKTNKTLTLKLNYISGYDSSTYEPIISPCSDAEIVFLGDSSQDGLTSDKNGKVKIRFTESSDVGEHLIMAYKEDNSIVPSVCRIEVKKGSSSGSGSGSGSSSGIRIPQKETTPVKVEIEKAPEKEPAPVFTEATYNDVKAGDWYYPSVKYAFENKLMQGTGDGFEPNEKMTRAMLITILWRTEKEPVVNYALTFEDTAADEWYTEAVRWAASEGIVSGIGGNLFGTDDEITREQLATILYRYALKKNLDTERSGNGDINAFADKEEVSEYAVAAVKWAVDKGILKGKTEKTISPVDSVTRAEAATMLMRFCEGLLK